MFTEGLDDNAINWVKQQGSAVQQQVRSPLAERVVGDGLMESPLYSTRSFLLSPKVLPPPSLFHSGLLGGVTARTMVGAGLDEEEGWESVASVDMDLGSSDLEEEEEEEEEELEVSDADDLCDKASFLRLYNDGRQGLVRGSSKENLRIEVPAVVARKMPDMVSAQSCKFFTPQGGSTCERRTPNQMDMGTPSAPPIGDIGRHSLETEGEQWRGEAQEGEDDHDTISAPTMLHSLHGSSGVEEERESLGTSVEGDVHSRKMNQMSSR